MKNVLSSKKVVQMPNVNVCTAEENLEEEL